MRYFTLLGMQHVFLYFLPALAFIVVFMAGLGYVYFSRKDSVEREHKIIERYPGGIEGRDAPFPLVLILTIGGTLIWALAYIVLIGVLGVRY